jgi:hypothetical protein
MSAMTEMSIHCPCANQQGMPNGRLMRQPARFSINPNLKRDSPWTEA